MVIELSPGRKSEARVDRNANRNGTARVMDNAELQKWFLRNHRQGNIVMIELVTSTHLRIRRIRR